MTFKAENAFDPDLDDLTAKQFQQKFQIGNTKYWELIHAGEIDAYRVGRVTRITGESSRRWRDRHRIDPNNVRGEVK
jgi:hypothetical protein